MLIFKDEDLGLTYECTTAEELAAAVAIHQRTHHQSIEAAHDLKIELANVVKNINSAPTPLVGQIKASRFPDLRPVQVYPSEFAQGLTAAKSIEQKAHLNHLYGLAMQVPHEGLGANQSAEQGDEGLPQPLQQADEGTRTGWLSPAQYSEPPATLTPAEEALANAYQEQDHLKLQSEVMRLRQELKERDLQIEFIGQQPRAEPLESISATLKAGMGITLADQIKTLEQARAGLAMCHMDTSGVDAMLRQHGLNYPNENQRVPQEPIWSPEFKGWNQFVEIMNNHGFGTQENEDRGSIISYLKALDRYLTKFEQVHADFLNAESRADKHFDVLVDIKRELVSKEQMLGQYRAASERAQEHLKLLMAEQGELVQEITALKKGNATLTAKLQKNKEGHERQLLEVDALLRIQTEVTREEVKIREAAVNDNIALSETNKELRQKLNFCFKMVPTLESAWELKEHDRRASELKLAQN